MAVAAACGQEQGERATDERISSAAQALAPKDISVDIVYPAGFGINTAAVGANGDIALGPGDHIVATDGTPGNVVNAASGGIIAVGPRGNLGNVASNGDISFGPEMTAVSARAARKVKVGPRGNVGTVQNGATMTPLVHRTLTISPPKNTGGDVITSPGAATTLAPGAYGSVAIAPNGVLTLSAGTYLVDNFALGPNAQVHLDTTKGAIYLWAKSSVIWNGTVTGDGASFVVGVLGQGAILINGGFQGTALAPSGLISLAPSATPYKGTFYGQHVSIGPDVTIQELPTPFLIDEIKISKTTVCVGEQTEVTVGASSAKAEGDIWVQGVAGGHQFVQFANAPGPRLVYASVYTADGRSDFVSVPVTVNQCAPSATPPIAFHFWGAKGLPNAAEFIVRDYDANGHEIPIAGPATYSWTFGDGKTATTSSPLVTHDYTSSMNQMAEHSFFTASVTVTRTAGASSATKVVPIWSIYAKNRSKGIVQPTAKLVSSGGQLGISLTNYEPTPITISSARIDLVPCDHELDRRPQPPQALSITIPASSSQTVNLPTPKAIGNDICAMSIHMSGSAPAGVVYADAYQKIKENPLTRQLVTDAPTIALLNRASALAANADRFDEFELRQLVAQGKLSRMPTSAAAGATYSSPGDECEPGDTDPVNGLVCMPTPDWVTNPPEILNAFKGDVFMDHGCGDIGKLITSLHQHFSHDAIFVKNHVEIRHSTASSDRVGDSVSYTAAKLDSMKMRFGFPGSDGTKTHTIDEMMNYYCVADPHGEGGSSGERGCGDDDGGFCQCPEGTWKMGGESSPDPVKCDEDYTPTPAIVVRPPASDLAAQQRAAAVADETMNIQSHYRFFMYSHGEKILTPAANDGADWATGTPSTVCSSFVALAATNIHVPMGVSSGLPDGLRFYDSGKRLTAARELHGNTYNKVRNACSAAPAGGAVVGGAIGLIGGPVGVLVGAGLGAGTGAEYCSTLSNNISNQMTNCFGSDGCDDTDETWKNPGDGIAVSPDDISNWPTPAGGGTWGVNEAAWFAPVSFRHRYAWRQSTGTGSMTITVKDANDNLVQGATIIVDDQVVGASRSDGTLHLDARPAGDYYVAAQLNECQDTKTPPKPDVPPADEIPTLQQCLGLDGGNPDVKKCQYPLYPGGIGCPPGWLDQQGYDPPANQCVLDPSGATVQIPDPNTTGDTATYNTVPQYLCACMAPPKACTELHPLESGGGRTTVTPGDDDKMTIHLCNGGLMPEARPNGRPGDTIQVPTACQQSCKKQEECDTGTVCDTDAGKCKPEPRMVVFSDTSLMVQTYDNDLFESERRRPFSPHIQNNCDLNPSDPRCICRPGTDSNGQPVAGHQRFQFCANDDDDESSTFVLDISCVQGNDGAIVVNGTAKLNDRCGGDQKGEDNTLPFIVGIVPASPSNPTPSADYGDPSHQAATCYDHKGYCDHFAAQFSLHFVSVPQTP